MPRVSRAKRKVLRHVSTLARYSYFENYSAAERLLNEVREDFKKRGVWGQGCFMAVKGMIASGRENLSISFFLRAKQSDPSSLKEMHESLMKDLARENIDDFERGFLEAWLTILETFIEIKKAMMKR
ncbi:MAG: hypothetical protein NDF54_07785 [archaeon GB-1867-035]|nr:hypothetical protein [Candidatus Culexmicrobium profundum]